MSKTTKDKFSCFYCGKNYVDTNYYNSNSEFYSSVGKIPYCKQCIEKIYQRFLDRYTNEGCLTPERKAVKRLCMAFDIYYREDVFNSSMKKTKEGTINISPIGQYMKTIQLFQYSRNKETYDNTISKEEVVEETVSNAVIEIQDDFKADEKTIEFFGSGFTDSDYKFLKREYEDWTARHECQTKAQEEVFKRICFTI